LHVDQTDQTLKTHKRLDFMKHDSRLTGLRFCWERILHFGMLRWKWGL